MYFQRFFSTEQQTQSQVEDGGEEYVLATGENDGKAAEG